MGDVFGSNFVGGAMGTWLGAFVFPVLVWSLVWKGWALWKAARAENKLWFVILLVVNTVGILDILYIFVFSKSPKKPSKRK